MNRLIIQHPQLADGAIAAFAQSLGRAAARRTPMLAEWHDVDAARETVTALAEAQRVDAALMPPDARLADYRLIVFDMDSTLITIECIDEIADYAGRKAEVAAITEAAMRGEITDFNESLRRRVALLAGLSEDVLQRVYDERLRLSPGVEPLLAGAHATGLKVLLVSGGFEFFTSRLRTRLNLDFTRSNTLGIHDGKLTGQVLGEIVNADVKRRIVEETCAQLGCSPQQAIVVGDGANDLKMMGIAGLSVAYRAKPIVRAQTTQAINHCGLDAILNWFVG